MGWSKANHWCTTEAAALAEEIAGISLYCGPTVVGWVAAVWNIHVQGRSYDYMTRLNDKTLFPDGPRKFSGSTPSTPYLGLAWQKSLNSILKRETNNELELSDNTLKRYGSIHDELERHDMPIIICMYPDMFSLHYVTLYKSEKKNVSGGFDKIQFYWQDNGIYGGENGGNPGLYKTNWRKIGWSEFSFGSRRVKKS